MSLATYYSTRNWGTPYGVVDAAHPLGHRGQDIKATGRTPIPAVRGGTVVLVQRSSILGNVVVIAAGTNDYDGYAHTVGTTLKPGQRIDRGETVALTAGHSDFHGSAWAGPHLHITNSPAILGVFNGTVRDPRPFIRTALTSTAGSTPIPIVEQEKDMKLIQQQSRGIAAVGSGYFKGLTAEELPYAIKLWGDPIVFADGDAGSVGARQFDLAKSVSLNGIAANDSEINLSPAQVSAAVEAALALKPDHTAEDIIAGVIAGMPKGATPEEIAKAVILEIAS